MSALLDDNQHRSGNERDVADTGMELHLQNLSMDQLSNEDIPVLDLASSPSNHDHSDHEGDPLSAGQATSDLAVTVGAQDVHQTPTRAGGVLMILPAELRIRVYKHVFSGSEVTLSIWDYRATRGDKEHRDGAGEKEHEARLTGISHSGSCYPLLLTGSTIHHDAMATYWATTVVHCQGASERCFLDDFVNVAPPALLENARHIRNIMLPHVSSKRVQGRPELRAQALLDRFPRLDSCEFVLSRTDRKYGKIKDVMSSDNMINSATGAPLVRWRHDYDYGFVLRCKQGSEPMVWLAAAYGIDTNYPVHCKLFLFCLSEFWDHFTLVLWAWRPGG